MFRGSMATFLKILAAAAGIAFLIGLYHNLWSVLENKGDEPLREPLSSLPQLEACLREVAGEFKRRMPKSVAILLSPAVWRRFGRDAARLRDRGEFCLPISLLALWPILSLRCYTAHTLIRRRPKKWLHYALRKSLIRLTQLDRARHSYGRSRTKTQKLIRLYLDLLFRWHVMADIEADARIARVYGDSAVSTWICQTFLGSQIAPVCLQQVLQPSADQGFLLPIASSCAAFYGLVEPGWLLMVEGERVKAQRSQPPANPLLGPLLMRLAVLPVGAARVQDPRPGAPCCRP